MKKSKAQPKYFNLEEVVEVERSNPYQIVFDDVIGEIFFPKMDRVMAPAIKLRGVWEAKE